MFLITVLAINHAKVVFFPKIFPALQRDRYVPISPQEVVKRAQTELVALSQLGTGEKMQDLTLSDLVADGLPGIGSKQRSLSFSCFLIHGHMLSEVAGGLRNSERSECKFYIDFNA